MSLLRFDQVSMSFARRETGRVVPLRAIDLDFADGSFTAVIGPSGCGKTTLLRLANGLIVPDQGQVLYRGRAPQPGPALGMVFQNVRLVPWMTVRENVLFALDQTTLPAEEKAARCREWLMLTGLFAHAESYPASLSGGMQQRVALARALAPEPGLLLMDEPFAALDAQTRELMQSELTALLARRQATTVFVTHSVDEALLLADRIVVLGGGRVVADLPVDLTGPRHRARGNAEYLSLRDQLWAMIRDLVLHDPASAFYGREQV